MEKNETIELLKKLESMVTFREHCLNVGDWDDYDKAEGEIRTLEHEIARKE